MNVAEALTREDRWRVIDVSPADRAKPFAVGRIMDASGTIDWHRGGTRYPAQRRGAIVTFAHQDAAEARANRLNRERARASQRAEAAAVTPPYIEDGMRAFGRGIS
jgi:predicted DNA-binding WGR domain protein